LAYLEENTQSWKRYKAGREYKLGRKYKGKELEEY
jgi:hypothetical protein